MRVDVIRGPTTLEPDAYWVEPRPDADRAGVWRFAGFIGVVLGGAAVWQGSMDRTLSARQRRMSAGAATTYAVGGAYVLRDPLSLGRGVTRHPRWTLLGTFAPLGAAAWSGGARTPLATLAAAAAGGSAVIYGERTGTRVARYALAAWTTQALAVPGERRLRPPWPRSYFVQPLTYLINARVASALTSLAYDARSLDSTLTDLADQRSELQRTAEELESELRAPVPELIRIAASSSVKRQRDLAMCALDRIHEARAALRVTLLEHHPQHRRRGRRYLRALLVNRRIREADRPVPIRSQSLAAIAQEQKANLEPVVPKGCTVTIDHAEDDVSIAGVDRIAVVAAAVTAGIANAIRHAPNVSEVLVTGADDGDGTLRIIVDNDGCEGDMEQLGAGLGTLKREAERLGGDLTAEPEPGGRFRMVLALPSVPAESESGRLVDWTTIIDKLDAVLLEGIGMSTLMVVGNMVARPSHSRARTAASAALTLAAPMGYAMQLRHRGSRSTTPALPLVVTALLSAVHAEPHRGILCGWANAALARDAFHNVPARTLLLITGNALGIVAAYTRARNRLPALSQLATLVSGPSAIAIFVSPAIDRLRQRERDVVSTMSAIETVNRIALQIHEGHSCLKPLDALAGDDDLGEADRAVMATARQRIMSASGTEASSYEALLGDLIGEISTVIGRRLFPASVAVRPHPDLRRRRSGDTAELNRMRLRRTAVGIANLIAREILGGRPARLDGRRAVTHVEIEVSSPQLSSTLHVTVSPVRREDDQAEPRVRQAIQQLGGAIVGWTESSLTFALYPAR